MYSISTVNKIYEIIFDFRERFGLYSVNFKQSDKKRTPKSSALFFQDIIKNNAIENVQSKKDDDFDISFLL